MITVRATLKDHAQRLKADTYAVYFVVQDSRTPWYAKALAAVVVGYALSPIDLVPDFIPVLGYLDDLILVPAGIWLVIKLVPSAVMDESRVRAAALLELDRPVSKTAAAVIVVIWIALSALFVGWVYSAVVRR